MVLLYSLVRDIGKTILLRLLRSALGSGNTLTSFVCRQDRNALAYGRGGEPAMTRLNKLVEPARMVAVDELERDKPVHMSAILDYQNAYRSVGSYNVRMATFIGFSVNTADPWTTFAELNDEDAQRILPIRVADMVDVPAALDNVSKLSDLLLECDAPLLILALLTECAQTPVPKVGTEPGWQTLDKHDKPSARGGAPHNDTVADMLKTWLVKDGWRLVQATNKDAQLTRAPVYEAAGIARLVRPGRGSAPVNDVLDEFILEKLEVEKSPDAGGSKVWCYVGVALAPAARTEAV